MFLKQTIQNCDRGNIKYGVKKITYSFINLLSLSQQAFTFCFWLKIDILSANFILHASKQNIILARTSNFSNLNVNYCDQWVLFIETEIQLNNILESYYIY